MLFPNDKLLAVGTNDQIEKLRAMIDATIPSLDELEDTADINFEIKSVTLTADSFLTGKTLRSANLRRYQCMVISVLHCEEIVTNPEPDFMFNEGDTAWLAGDLQSLGWI